MFHSYDLDSFGKAIRSIRKRCGYTQRQIREVTGINTDTLRKIENGMVIPKYETLEVLSIVYRYDLLKLLMTHRSESFIKDFSSNIDRIILSYNVEDLVSLVNAFKSYKNSHSHDIELIEHKHIQQYELFLISVTEYYTNTETDRLKSQDLLIETMQISRPEFTIENATHLNYNYFEIRILLFIGINMRAINDTENAIRVLKHCLDFFSIDDISEWTHLHLILKVYFNLAYCYHTADKHEQVIEVADEAITLARSHHSTYCLGHIYYRRGIAEYLLGRKEYINSLKTSIQILNISGEETLAERFIDITKETYGIEL